jgi:hypothetical protein
LGRPLSLFRLLDSFKGFAVAGNGSYSRLHSGFPEEFEDIIAKAVKGNEFVVVFAIVSQESFPGIKADGWLIEKSRHGRRKQVLSWEAQ